MQHLPTRLLTTATLKTTAAEKKTLKAMKLSIYVAVHLFRSKSCLHWRNWKDDLDMKARERRRRTFRVGNMGNKGSVFCGRVGGSKLSICWSIIRFIYLFGL